MQKGDYCCLGAMICRGVCIMVITHHFFGWRFGKDISSCVEVLKGEKNGLICNQKKNVIGSKLSNKCWVQLVCTLGGGGACHVHFPPSFTFSHFHPLPGVGLSCTFTYPK